jgi:hypothetical protein
MTLIRCEECGSDISDKAWICPKCGYPIKMQNLPFPMRLGWWSYEWKSETTLFGWPLVHIAWGWDWNTGRLRVAKGIIAIGQFGIGLITIAQFGIGLLFCLGQFVVGFTALGQFAGGVLFAAGQFAVGLYAYGQFAAGKYVRAWIDFGDVLFGD